MMILEYVKQGEGVYPEFVIDGSVLSVGSSTFDLEELQAQGVSVKDVFKGSNYLANIFIPSPRFYHEEIVGEDEETEYRKVKEPVNMNAVKLVLWKTKEDNKEA
jgi:hypothetical protein